MKEACSTRPIYPGHRSTGIRGKKISSLRTVGANIISSSEAGIFGSAALYNKIMQAKSRSHIKS
jgi:hypothetical protein